MASKGAGKRPADAMASAKEERAVDAIRGQMGKAQSHERQLVIRQIVELLQENPAPAHHILWMLRNGAFDKDQEGAELEGILECQKWRQLKAPVVRQLLEHLEPTHAEKFKVLKAKCLVPLLCFLLRVDPSSALYSKRLETLKETSMLRYVAKGRSHSSMVYDGTGQEIDWSKGGYFGVLDGRELQYCSGQQVTLDVNMRQHAWSLQKNDNFLQAALVDDLVSVLCVDVFKKAEVDINDQPEFLTAMPEA